MQQEDDEFYQPYSESYPFLPPQRLSASVEIPDIPPDTPVPLEQDSFPPPNNPTNQVQPSPPPRKRSERIGAIILLVLALALIFGTGLFAGWQFANSGRTVTTGKSTIVGVSSLTSATTTGITTLETQQEAAIAKIEPAVVELNVTTGQGQQIGSGVIIDAQGDIVTNNHVVSGAQTIEAVLNTGRSEQAQLVGTNAANDLAVVRIQPFAHMTVARIGDSSQLVIGQEVLAVGNPLGITETATHGIISALNRSIPESRGITLSQAVQTDAPVNPGNSGGALVNMQGELIGIPTVIAVNTESNTTANGVSFAIPSNLVKAVVRQMLLQ